ncbi:SRPBCC family protein [Aquimarina sp. RZ0]|uniref:SRPBCC family protein n=1 Tax=Aquimarina sp. RZ0 TaxID=2607730 RepID=UPI001660001E|nr:SRPBCC family protein [Aquimarina sp. RZ0]
MKRKILMLSALLMATSNSEVMAQQEKKYTELKTITTSEFINVSADTLWRIISDPNISRWSTLIDSTEYFGEEIFKGVPWSKRTSMVNSKGHHESHEDLIFHDDSRREIKFASTKFPGFIIANETHWKVIDNGPKQSLLRTTTIMKMKKLHAFFLKKTMLKAINRNGNGIYYDIKHYAENGKVSLSKANRIKELQKKQLDKRTKNRIIKKTLRSDIINVSEDSLWKICREFDKTAVWTSTLHHSYGIGKPEHEGTTCSSRVCETNIGKGNELVEKLVMFSDKNKELSYDLIEGAPGFIILANNHWKVIKVAPNQSKIEMNVTLHMKRFTGFFLHELITSQMKKEVNIVLSELKIYSETGKVPEAKRKQIEKQKKKEKRKQSRVEKEELYP